MHAGIEDDLRWSLPAHDAQLVIILVSLLCEASFASLQTIEALSQALQALIPPALDVTEHQSHTCSPRAGSESKALKQHGTHRQHDLIRRGGQWTAMAYIQAC